MKMSTEPDIIWIPPAELKARIRTIPLPKKVKDTFLKLVTTWVRSSGSEWTVDRLKSFKDCVAQSYANAGELSHKPMWFATTPSGKLSGIFGTLWSIAMTNHSQLKAVLFLVNIYTGCRRKTHNTSILDEICRSIQERALVKIPKQTHQRNNVSKGDIHRAVMKLGWKGSLKVNNDPIPITWSLPGKESHVVKLLGDLQSAGNLPLLTKGASRALNKAAGVFVETGGSLYYPMDDVGEIHMTHEPGLKTRYFAAPNLVAQRALEPLKESLLRFLDKVPWDCTKDQRKADKTILTALASGREVHSVDLSSATDAFPWDFQLEVLRTVGKRYGRTRGYTSLLSSVVKGNWLITDDREVRFSTGQALGLGPSFPIFTLSHGLLLYILNGYKWDKEFYVLGDDVIILNDSLVQRYREVLERWGVGVSETKSFSSSYIAQFAGVTYTRDGSFWVPKWRPFTGAALLDLAAWWYPGLTQGLPANSLIERVLSMPQPYGCGRNPKGLPLDERFDDFLVEELVENEMRRAEAAMPSSTRPDVQTLSDILLKNGIPESQILDLITRIQYYENLANPHRRFWNVRQKPTGFSLHPLVAELMHRTETGGYPLIRFRHGSKVDPYTLGPLKLWKRLLGRSAKRKSSVEES